LPYPIEKDEKYETLAGCLTMKFGKIPNVKGKITFNSYELTILKKNKTTVILVQLTDLKG